MAEEDQLDDAEVDALPKDRQGRETAAALDKITDSAPERLMDEGKVQQAMQTLQATQKATKEAERLKEKELAGVKFSKEDVDVIVLECEVDRKAAERRLREHGGNLTAALKSFL